ncbi:hypothetical protein NAPIS_ORF02178 [Vairimorpha apis BRL 01]|uniref:Uncharacterized protein n=1 Tax=Vairimorpha apis BRL 01 TaxID=1037528 RepID=T0MGW7_9MICR|nr:hypothetical protein NAPIS_ORF02178 [Vairimorpha apis BRL 01]
MHLILSLIIFTIETSHISDYKNDKIFENNYNDIELFISQNTFNNQSKDELYKINMEEDILIDNNSIEEDLNEMCEKYLCNIQNSDIEDIHIENLYPSINFYNNCNLKIHKTIELFDDEIYNKTQLNNFYISEYYYEYDIIYNNIGQLSRSKEFYFLFKIIEKDLENIITNSILYSYKDNEFLKNALLKIKLLKIKCQRLRF